MTERLLFRADIRREQDVVLVHQRARKLAGLLGFDPQDQTRIATSVSEIARNAFEYAGGGRAALLVDRGREPACLVRISDEGPGIPHLAEVLDGRHWSATGMGLGISGARRLSERFEIGPGKKRGTVVTLGRRIPPAAVPALTDERLAEIARMLGDVGEHDQMEELQARNHELLRTLDDLKARQDEVERLNSELAETNRGVLALYAELDDRALQLARASELKSSFLSSISHELRTPLNAILNVTRLLIDRYDGDLSEEQERQVHMIRNAATSLTEMVNDLLDLARIEAGKAVLRPAPVQVNDLLGSVRGMLRPLLTSNAIALVLDPPEASLRMHSDEAKLAQVLRNLVANAVKFTEAGEIRIAARHHPADDTVVFTVADTGIGIAPEDLERIFEEYTQVDSPLQRRLPGTGLGLPLSRKLARMLGGSLTVESEPGRGSTFTLRVARVLPDVLADEGGGPGAPGAEREVQYA
jgi:signal transduction histidine kinase